MDFKVYQVFENVNTNGRERALHHFLRDTDFFEGDHGLRYVINNDIELDEDVIVGTISQEFVPNSYKVDEDKAIEVMGDIEPYERAFFAYDFQTRAFLIQNRTYPPENLNPGKTLTRINDIFDGAYQAIFGSSLTLIPVLLPEGNDIFFRLFDTHRVVEIFVTDINEGRLLGEEVILSDNTEENNAMKMIWNNDDSLTDSIHLKTTSNGSLNNSLIAIAALNSPNAIVNMIKYYDPEEDGFVTKKRSKFDQFTVPNINRNTESITAFNEITNEIRNNRAILRRMRQVQNE